MVPPSRYCGNNAIRYAPARRDSLTRFLDDRRVEIGTNTVKRTIRPIPLGRKYHPFAGSDGGTRTRAIVASVTRNAKLKDIEPFAFRGRPVSRPCR